MKKYLICILLFIGFEGVKVNAANPKFFIVSQSKSDLVDAKSILPAFETELYKELMKTFPCIDYMDQGSLGEMLRWERMRQLLGSGSDEELQNIAGGIGSDYLIKFTVTMIGNKMYMNAFCMDSKKAITIARTDATGTIGQALANAKKVSKDLVKQMEEYEICPYLGPLNIEVKSNRDEATTSSGPAPCDGGTVTTTVTINSKETLNWKLNKVARRVTTGEVKYDLTEDYKTVRSYSCYECKDGLKTSMTFTDTRNSEAKAEGLSNESISEGKKIDDARVQIVFKDDGTYLVLVKATSKKGNLKETTETKTQGACEGESKPPVTKNKSIDIPITAVFGPYQGSAEDKVLSQKETKDVSQGKETTTVSIDFNLVKN
jgi:hypothetical protein